MIYLAVMVVVAVAGILRLWLQQRRERLSLEKADHFWSGLERISVLNDPREIAASRMEEASLFSRARLKSRQTTLDPARRAAARRRVEARRRAEAKRAAARKAAARRAAAGRGARVQGARRQTTRARRTVARRGASRPRAARQPVRRMADRRDPVDHRAGRQPNDYESGPERRELHSANDRPRSSGSRAERRRPLRRRADEDVARGGAWLMGDRASVSVDGGDAASNTSQSERATYGMDSLWTMPDSGVVLRPPQPSFDPAFASDHRKVLDLRESTWESQRGRR